MLGYLLKCTRKKFSSFALPEVGNTGLLTKVVAKSFEISPKINILLKPSIYGGYNPVVTVLLSGKSLVNCHNGDSHRFNKQISGNGTSGNGVI